MTVLMIPVVPSKCFARETFLLLCPSVGEIHHGKA